MISIKNGLFFATTIASLASCVSQKKYDRLLTDKVKLEGENAICNDSLNQFKTSSAIFKAESEKLNKENKTLKDDTTLTNSSYRRTKALYTEEVTINDRLKKDYKTLLDNSSAESSTLTKNLLRKEDELRETAKKNGLLSDDLQKLSADLKARESRVKDLEQVLANKDKAVNELKARVSEALLSFKDKDLTINVKNGKVYVSLAEQLLFKSGSIEVDKKGAEAIKKLATVLKEQKDINVMVEGHTDDVPMKGSNCITDNWDLSVLRATSIVKILTHEGVDPKKLSPCGRGENAPVAEGKSVEARQKNRRTEIILTPKLDELFKILETN